MALKEIHSHEQMLQQLQEGKKNYVLLYKSLFDSALFVSNAADGEAPQKRVTVYSTPTCTWCTTLKRHLDQHGVKYREIDVSKDQKAAEQMVKKSGQQGVPQTDINGKMIIGFDKTKINSLLGLSQN